MRLGQLARKLGLRPAEIVNFLAGNHIIIEDGSNTRLEDEHVVRVMQQFAPDRTAEVMQEPDEIEEPVRVEVIPTRPVEPMNQAEETPEEEPGSPGEPGKEKPEVIKAPKVELPGLKVLGKIEIPGPKKKETTATDSAPLAEGPGADQVPGKPLLERRKWPVQKNGRREQRQVKNPIALQREQEAQEAERKRKAEAERRKELKTQHYYKKVKPVTSAKPFKFIDEPVNEAPPEPVRPPRTVVGKFLKWLRR